MKRGYVYILSVLIVLVCFGFNLLCVPEDVAEKVLSLDGIFRTSYALGGDLAGLRGGDEAIYVAKGNIQKALSTLKDILIEQKRPRRSFSKRDSVNIIIFRGALPTLGKIEVTKFVSKGNTFEVYAKYIDFPELDIPSQPAAIIPLGKLPSGKYSVDLYVDNQSRKKVEFKIRR